MQKKCALRPEMITLSADRQQSTSLLTSCSDGTEMFGHVEKLRAGLRNLAVVSRSSASSERWTRRYPVLLNYHSC